MPSSAALPTRSQSMTQGAPSMAPVVLLGRLFFALIFVMAGPDHFSSQTIAYAASRGVPPASIAVPSSGVIALLGGLSILLGYHTRIGASLTALFLIGVTPTMCNFWKVGSARSLASIDDCAGLIFRATGLCPMNS